MSFCTSDVLPPSSLAETSSNLLERIGLYCQVLGATSPQTSSPLSASQLLSPPNCPIDSHCSARTRTERGWFQQNQRGLKIDSEPQVHALCKTIPQHCQTIDSECPLPRLDIYRTERMKMVSTWPWGIIYGCILGWMNIHLPPILMFTRGTGF